MAYINPSKLDTWATPKWLFDALNAEFCFELDACATEKTAKCSRYFSMQEDAFLQSWSKSTFCNPPYGKPIEKWILKARQEAEKGNRTVMLLPARTDSGWFHDYCLSGKSEIRFLRGRLCFDDGKGRAPFPSMVVIFR